MPIYEFFCARCNRVYSFLAKTAAGKTPQCPKCHALDLKKMVSRFAVGRARRPAAADAAGADPDASAGPAADPAAEREMTRLLSAAEDMDENDPRQLGRLLRKMSEATGERLDGDMEDAVRRLESGEDPERVEDDMAECFDDGDGDGGTAGGAPPSFDQGLYPV